MLTPVRVLAVGVVAALSTGLLAVSLSGPSADRAGGFGAPGTSPSAVASPAGGQPIDWDTGCVRLTADGLRINTDTEGTSQAILTRRDPVVLRSDPGPTPTARSRPPGKRAARRCASTSTSPPTRTAGGSSELRTYDGQPTPDWIAFPGPLFQTPLDETYTGDVLLDSVIGNVPGAVVQRHDAEHP